MTGGGAPPRFHLVGRLAARRTVAAGLERLDVELPRPVDFRPGQFAMVNLPGSQRLVFSRPMSLLEASGDGISFLYRVVGRGTGLLASAPPGTPVEFLGPLGNAFPGPPAEGRVVLVAGGCGLPPLWNWWRRHARPGDRAWFGARSGAEVPWELLDGWRVAVERREGVPAGGVPVVDGLVVDACAADAAAPTDGPTLLLACGPRPMLEAAHRLAKARGWGCLVSVEERMGCGYGVCRGCVVPDPAGGHRTACREGPVLAAADVDWEAFAATAATPRAACGTGEGATGAGDGEGREDAGARKDGGGRAGGAGSGRGEG